MTQKKDRITTHGFIFKQLDYLIGNLITFLEHICDYFREFLYSQNSIFEIIFTIIYFIEQLFLFYVLLTNPYQMSIETIIGIFVLILLTTKAIETILLQSKNRHLREQVILQNQVVYLERISFEENMKAFEKDHNELVDKYNELLKQRNTLLNKIFLKSNNRKKR